MCHAIIKNNRARQERLNFLLTIVKFFFKTSKKSIFEGTGGSAENGSKTWSKCHFLLLYRRKRRQKVVKKCSNPGGRAGPTNRSTEPTFCKFFVFLIKIYSVVKMSTRYNVRTPTLRCKLQVIKFDLLDFMDTWTQVRPRGLSQCKCGTHSRSADNTSSLLTFFQTFKSYRFDAEFMLVVFIETATEPEKKFEGQQARVHFFITLFFTSILEESSCNLFICILNACSHKCSCICSCDFHLLDFRYIFFASMLSSHCVRFIAHTLTSVYHNTSSIYFYSSQTSFH